MLFARSLLLVLCLLTASATTHGAIIVNYLEDAGGQNTQPLNGLAARATFEVSGTHLSILLENTSTGLPPGFQVADSLLVSLGMNLPAGVLIASGDTAVIGPGSVGMGSWVGRIAGDNVAEEWLWTNEYGGDLMERYAQVISTSSGQGGGTVVGFGGGNPSVNGPYGGMAANPPILNVPPNKPAVSNSIRFELTLTAPLSENELAAAAADSIVEYGSDQRYLKAPEPRGILLGLVVLVLRRRLPG